MSAQMPRETRLHRRGNGRYYLKAWVPEDVRHLVPGDMSLMESEIEELLIINKLNISPNSPSWRRLGFALLKAQKRSMELLQQRQQGEVVNTPAQPKAAPDNAGVTVQELIDEYMADPSKKRTPSTIKTCGDRCAVRSLAYPDAVHVDRGGVLRRVCHEA